MSVKSLLVFDGELKAIAMSELRAEHRLLAALVHVDGKDQLMHPSDSGFEAVTPIGVRSFSKRTHKSVTRFDLFCRLNEEKLVYPAEANGAHAIDVQRFTQYAEQAFRSVTDALVTNGAPDQDLIDHAMHDFAEMWPWFSSMQYLTAAQYQIMVDRMITSLIEEFERNEVGQVTLVIDEDPRGVMMAAMCWSRISRFVERVVTLSNGVITERSRRTLMKGGRDYLAFTDASFNGDAMLSIYRELGVIESVSRKDGNFRLFFAAPIKSYRQLMIELKEYDDGIPPSNLKEVIGAYIGREEGQRDATNSPAWPATAALFERVTGWTPDTTRIYCDLFITHPENDTEFLTGRYKSATTSRPTFMKLPAIVDNYNRDKHLLHFASSIKYEMPSKTGQMVEIMNMTDVLFNRR